MDTGSTWRGFAAPCATSIVSGLLDFSIRYQDLAKPCILIPIGLTQKTFLLGSCSVRRAEHERTIKKKNTALEPVLSLPKGRLKTPIA